MLPGPKIPFGKYRGKRLSKIPSDYLQWCLAEYLSLDDQLRAQIEKELAARGEMNLEETEIADMPPGLSRELCEKIGIIYKRLAMENHPDRGGSPEAMKAINEFHAQVQNLIKRTLDAIEE